jgi:hypothetical protein
MMKEFLTRLRFFFFRPRQGELDEELQFHLEQATESFIAAGMAPEEAQRQARVLFGGVEAARENCREEQPGWWLGTVVQDVRYALRGFRRAPVFAVTVIATLAQLQQFSVWWTEFSFAACPTGTTTAWYRSDWCNRSNGRSSRWVAFITSGMISRSRLPR